MEEKNAHHGEKMIEVRIRFWTNDIAEKKDYIIPKHAWTSGVVMIQSNKSHGIVPQNPVPFHTFLDLPSIIEKVLISHNIRMHPSEKFVKYLDYS